ncbi:hypothetical protein JCM19240_1974 [Vibrio maritimus]|uniref:Uncharacterized protein n=1 Tax=Vibrio maritimus TaxID=990268 RepID=A0A090T263_9VIBR|nr:hypothetical protein JCM19240_1974 [Vibrio maritimus]
MSLSSELTHPECSKLILNTQNIALWTIILIGGTAILVVGKSLLIPIVLSVFLAILLSSFRELSAVNHCLDCPSIELWQA